MTMTLALRRVFVPFGIAMLIGLGLALLLAVGWLGASGKDVAALMGYLIASSSISLSLGVIGLSWLRRGRGRLWQQLALAYTLGIGIALLNISLTAKLMFISINHDLLLLILLMLFSAVISLGLGYGLAQALTQRVNALHSGARAVAAGQFATRVAPEGNDELTELAVAFNHMATQLAAAALERDRMIQARQHLLAAISHDLRTPLASLRARTEALADGLVDDPATRAHYLTSMHSQINLLSSLIDDLFELAQIDAGVLRLDLQWASLGDLISDTLEGMRLHATRKGVLLQGSIVPHLGPLMIAPQKIERVLYNLVTNAIRHTPSGGTVTITVTPTSALTPTDAPAVNATMHHTAILVEVADTGEGIAPEDLPRIFEHFYRSEKSRSRATGGVGLGLAIAHGIIQAHGGHIWATSTPDQGTSIRFTLPYHDTPNERAES